MIKIDATQIKNAVGFAAFKTVNNTLDQLEKEGPSESGIRTLYHQMEILSKLDDESKGISYATEENSPCMDDINVEKYDEHKSVVFDLMVLNAPIDIILKEYTVMHRYVFYEEDLHPLRTIFDIVLINSIDGDETAFLAFKSIFEFYADEFKDIDIEDVCGNYLLKNYSSKVARFLVTKGIFSTKQADSIRISSEIGIFNYFSKDWKTDYKIGYLKNAEIKAILAKEYDKAVRYLTRWLELDMPESSPFEETIADLPCELLHEVVEKNDPDILKTFLMNIEDDNRFDKQAIADEFDYQFEEFWVDSPKPRDDEDPTEILEIMKNWKSKYGISTTN